MYLEVIYEIICKNLQKFNLIWSRLSLKWYAMNNRITLNVSIKIITIHSNWDAIRLVIYYMQVWKFRTTYRRFAVRFRPTFIFSARLQTFPDRVRSWPSKDRPSRTNHCLVSSKWNRPWQAKRMQCSLHRYSCITKWMLELCKKCLKMSKV